MIDTLTLSRRRHAAGMAHEAAAEARSEGLAEAGVAAMLLAPLVVVRRRWSA